MPNHAPLPSATEVVVVGAGLAGLACALLLERRGIDVHVLESSDAVGGRVRTDDVDGFKLDRGFQVLLTAYEEVQSLVDLPRLDPRPFRPGSMIWTGRRLKRLPDPFRDPLGALAGAVARVGSLSDKLRVAKLRRRLLAQPPRALLEGPDRSTAEELAALGFSDQLVESFFRPFLGGVFLERDLDTSARLFRYLFRCFAAGEAVLPALGMQRLPELLAEPLAGRITLGCPVRSVSADGVVVDGGTRLAAERVVVAVDGPSASRLLGSADVETKASVTAYFACTRAPVRRPLLVLDGEGSGPVNHLAVLSHVSPAYAPEGFHLVSASGVGEHAEDPDAFRRAAPGQLRRWFGESVDRWEHLATYRVPHALPCHPAGSLDRVGPRLRGDGVVLAGDYTELGSIQGALRSGRRAAEAVLERRPPSSRSPAAARREHSSLHGGVG